MVFFEDISLKKFNSFKVDAKASYLYILDKTEELYQFYSEPRQKLPVLILGGGNNILFTKDFNGYVLKVEIKGKEIIYEDDDYIQIKVNAGEDWDEFVAYCVKNNFGGIENLSLIPGLVGSCPIQNIGAYGVEVKDVINEVHAFNIKTKKTDVFNNAECQFEYRNSIFKSLLKNTHIITSVIFKLDKKPVLKTNYEAVQKELDIKKITTPDIKVVRQIICDIRQSKLPDPQIIGNAGSFFKNPVVTKQLYESVHKKYPDIIAYNLYNGQYKIAAGWLIEKNGWKGYRESDAGVNEKQALVLINYGNAKGTDILNLANKIKQNILDTFKIELDFEVNIL